MICSRCNIENPVGARFCKNCGAPIDDVQTFDKEEVLYEYSKKNTGSLVGGIIMILVCVILCIVLSIATDSIFIPGGVLGVGGVFAIINGAKRSRFTVKRNRVDVNWSGKDLNFHFSDMDMNKVILKGNTLKINKYKFKFDEASKAYDAICKAKEMHSVTNLR